MYIYFLKFFLQKLYIYVYNCILSFYLLFLQVLYSQSQKYLDTNICLTLMIYIFVNFERSEFYLQ